MEVGAVSTTGHGEAIAKAYTILYYIILYYTILYYTILYYTLLCYAILCYTMLYYAILYYTMLCCAMLYYAILYYAMLCYAILCYAMLCYTILSYFQPAWSQPASQIPHMKGHAGAPGAVVCGGRAAAGRGRRQGAGGDADALRRAGRRQGRPHNGEPLRGGGPLLHHQAHGLGLGRGLCGLPGAEEPGGHRSRSGAAVRQNWAADGGLHVSRASSPLL